MEVRLLERVAGGSGPRREIGPRSGGGKASEDVPVLIVNRRRGYLAFGRKRAQDFLRALRILKGKSGGAVGADDLREHAHVHGERAPESDQLIRDDRAAHEEKGETARQQDDQHQLSLDWGVAQENGHIRV